MYNVYLKYMQSSYLCIRTKYTFVGTCTSNFASCLWVWHIWEYFYSIFSMSGFSSEKTCRRHPGRQAKCTVLVIQHHCGQTFTTHLGGWKGRSLIRGECKAQPRDFFFNRRFSSIFENQFLVFENRILSNREFLVESDKTLHFSWRDKD